MLKHACGYGMLTSQDDAKVTILPSLIFAIL